MGDIKEFEDSATFWGISHIIEGKKLHKIEDSSLVILGYQLLALATSKIMDENKEFEDSPIFWGVLLIVWGESFRTLKMHHWLTLVT